MPTTNPVTLLTPLPTGPIAELAQLFTEFRTTYLPAAAAQQYLGLLRDARGTAQINYAQLVAQVAQGTASTEDLLYRLLPHADTSNNRWRGAWIHPVAAIVGDLRTWYEAAGWTAAEDWPALASALLGFVRQAVADPAHLADACAIWRDLPYTTGFQSGLLTPILNALRPDAYLLLNNQSRNALNYFAGTDFAQLLTDYPAANAQLQTLLTTLNKSLQISLSDPTRLADEFLLFSHWLATEKAFAFRASRAWALAVGADPWVWREWCEGNMIAVGGPGAWDELGDLTGVTRQEFYRRRDSLIAQHSSWTKRSAEAIWRFARQMHEGDSVAVYHEGTILGIGTIGGPYYFIPEVPLGHRRPMVWRDLVPRRHGTTFAQGVVTPIDATLLAALATAPVQEAGTELLATTLLTAAHESEKAQPEFVRYLAPMLEVLQSMGGQGRAGEVMDAVRDRLADAGEAAADSPTRTNRLRRHLYRARHYLLRAGYLTTEQHGIWQLTAKGRNSALADGEAQQFYEEIEYQQQLTESLVDAGETVRRLAETPVPYVTTPPSPTPPLPTPPLPMPIQPYPLTAVAAATFLPEEQLGQWVQAIERKGQAIFYGPPGVGKTFLAEQLARHLAGGLEGDKEAGDKETGDGATQGEERDGFVETVQFHAAYAYEDFVQGMRPQPGPAGQLSYPIIPGRFLTFCAEAAQRQGRSVFLIDEINRADLARVFGELMYLLEYRDRSVRLAADGRPFAIPANVRILGTMNTADRSIALVDHALRRRFAFIALQPDWGVLRRFHAQQQTGFAVDALVTLLQRINRQIGDAQYAIGHSYFMRADLAETLPAIWQLEIEPYLEELFFDQAEAVELLRWGRVRGELAR